MVYLRNETFTSVISATPLRHRVSQRRHSHSPLCATGLAKFRAKIIPNWSALPCDTVATHSRHRCDTKERLGGRRGVLVGFGARMFGAVATPLRTHCRDTVVTGHTVLASQGRHRNGRSECLAPEAHHFSDMPKSTPIICTLLGRGCFDH